MTYTGLGWSLDIVRALHIVCLAVDDSTYTYLLSLYMSRMSVEREH